MNRKMYVVSLAILAIVTLSAPIYAHHGGASYDAAKSITLKATITDFKFTNPHAAIYFDVKDASGNPVHWAAELGSPSWLVRKNWTRNSLKAGDEVTIVARPNKDETVRVVSLQKVVFSSGEELDNGQPQ